MTFPIRNVPGGRRLADERVSCCDRFGCRPPIGEAADRGHHRVVRYDPMVHRWEPFTVAGLIEFLAPVAVPWWLSGGYALEEFLGRSTRAHGDIDVTVARQNWPVMQAALRPVLDVFVARDGHLFDVDEVGVPGAVRNLWARELGGGPFRVQFNLEPIAEGVWTYARDGRVQLPVEQATWWSSRAWCINPAVQLLWKAKTPCPKDEQDYSDVVPRLTTREKAWLHQAVRTAHPASPWVPRLDSATITRS